MPLVDGMYSISQSRWTGFQGLTGGETAKAAGSVPTIPLWAMSGPWSKRGSRVAHQAVCSTTKLPATWSIWEAVGAAAAAAGAGVAAAALAVASARNGAG